MNRLSSLVALCLALASIAVPALAHDRINTVVGGGPSGIPGLAVNLGGGPIAIDAEGNLYVVATYQYYVGAIYKISPNGIVTHIAGDGSQGYDGASGSGLLVQLYAFSGIAVDSAIPANVYIADTFNCVIQKLDQKTGQISVVAGVVDTSHGSGPLSHPLCGYSGDGGPANAAELAGPVGLTINPVNGDLYFFDGAGTGSDMMRKIAGGTPQGTISTVAGVANVYCTQPQTVNGSSPTAAPLCGPAAIGLDSSVTPANVFLSQNCEIDEIVGSTNKLYRIAGQPICGFVDNVSAPLAELGVPAEIHVAAKSGTATIQIADGGNSRVRQFTVSSTGGVPHPGLLTTIAGAPHPNCVSSNTQAINACMSPGGITDDGLGNLYISDASVAVVRKVSISTGAMTSLTGWLGVPWSNPLSLDNALGQPQLFSPGGVFADPDSNKVYVGGGDTSAVYVWDSATHRISDFAGNGFPGFGSAGDGSPANSPTTQLATPNGMAKDSQGNIYIADNSNIRRVDASTGIISTFAGTPSVAGYSGDGGPASSALFNAVNSIAFDAADNMYLADSLNCVIRKIAAHTTLVSTIAGGPLNRCRGYDQQPSGNEGPATLAPLCYPNGVSVDPAGNIYIADTCNSIIRRITAATGIIRTIAGTYGNATNNGYYQPYTGLILPTSVKADRNGNVFFTDGAGQTANWLTPDGIVTTFAGVYSGDTTGGSYGDGGIATNANFNGPSGIDQDSYGNFYIVDSRNNRIRQVSAFPAFGLTAKYLSFPSQKVGTSKSHTVTLSSIGPTRIQQVTASDGFEVSSDCAGKDLSAGQTCKITVSFTPAKAGSQQGFVRIYSNALFSQPTISLSGSGQ